MIKCEEISIKRIFAKYVSQNILGMLGMSAYILADTFFISKAAGANGITALNLVLPIYSLIFAIGAMIGVGSATRFKIDRARKVKDSELYFSDAVSFAIIIGMFFVALGIAIPEQIVTFMGGSSEIVKIGAIYTRIFMIFTPFFMMNYIFNAFVRNDNNPTIAMIATFSSSIFNIIMDYVLMFPLNMGMAGAALATAFSPIVGITICCVHLFSRKSTIKVKFRKLSIKRLVSVCQLGVAAFVGEISSGVTTMVFNILILEIAGNIGIAAYGIIANVAIVAVSIFNGIAQGAQPILSEAFGKADNTTVKKVLKMSVVLAIIMSVLIFLIINIWAKEIVGFFNSENNIQMAEYAIQGIKIYFFGFIFAGFNIVGTGYLSATDNARWAFVTSIMRGFVAITFCAVVLAKIFGMLGVWSAFSVSELITAIVMSIAITKNIVNKSVNK